MQDAGDKTAAGIRTGPLQVASGNSVVSLTTLITITVVCAILYVARDLFLPLALGMLFAFILSPVVTALRHRGLRDTPAVILTVLLAAGVVGTFVLILAYQISQIGANLPQYQGNVLGKVDALLAAGTDNRIVAHLQGMIDTISQRLDAEGTAPAAETGMVKVEVVERSGLKAWATDVILPALTPVGIFGLIWIIVVFALLERATLRDRLVQLIGGSNIPATSRLLAEAGARVSTYLLAQLVVNVIYAVPIWLGLWLIGVPNALFFGVVTLVLRFLPYIGSAVSALLPLVMAFAVSPDWSLVLWTAALFLLVELVTSNIVEPWFYGQRTGVSPLAVIVSAMFWTWLWGPMGLIIATPLTVCLVVIGRHVPNLRLFPIMFGDRPPLEESARLYDRLLAGRSFEFTSAAAASTEHVYLAEYHDKTALPALALAQADHGAGLLGDYQAERIAHAARTLIEDLEGVIEDELADDTPQPAETTEGPMIRNGVRDGLGRRIALLGAETLLDDAAARMVGQAMRAEGAEVETYASPAALSRSLGDFKPEAVVVVTLNDAAPGLVDRMARTIRRKRPEATVILAQWPENDAAGVPEQGKPKGVPQVRGMEALFEAVFRPGPVAPLTAA